MKKINLVTVGVLLSLVLAGCSADKKEEGTAKSTETAVSSSVASDEEATSGATEQIVVPEGTYAMKQLYTAPHGENSFAVTTLVMDGEKILAATMDEFQYVAAADFEGVPNSDAGFGENYPKDLVLASKVVNNKAYSAMMADKGKATQTYVESMTAITEYAVGKTAADLQKEFDDHETMAEVITGATFADASGYVESIIKTALYGHTVAGSAVVEGDLKVQQAYSAPHGDKSFAVTTTALVNDKIVAAYLDEFQFVADMEGVPNSDAGFGENYPEGLQLIAKSDNDEAYSAMMKEKGQATQTYAVSMEGVITYVLGKTTAELEKDVAANENMSDVVTGATFADTAGYVNSFIDVSK